MKLAQLILGKEMDLVMFMSFLRIFINEMKYPQLGIKTRFATAACLFYIKSQSLDILNNIENFSRHVYFGNIYIYEQETSTLDFQLI
uniref:Uncharacterized protein n=1 Tax=Octopus bimaculoides TaxID=37653 RepID=A0A0L8G5N9_OCTBM